ncbi:MAG TPA: hypothetical protein VN612_11140 [Acidobacteriaceae bacterium]|nr:hypothetical protein [Acidobacteriaceae bacterium]
MHPEETYWDELGLAWRTTESGLETMTPHLQARLRCQSFAVSAALMLGIPLCIAGIALGAFTVWRGWTTGTWNFVTRGFAIAIISALLVRALASFPFSARIDTQNLSAMLDIAIARLRRTLFLVRTAIIACAIAGAFGIVGAVLRTRAGSPPRLSPIVDLIIIVMMVSFLGLYARALSAEARKFDYLRRTLAAGK